MPAYPGVIGPVMLALLPPQFLRTPTTSAAGVAQSAASFGGGSPPPEKESCRRGVLAPKFSPRAVVGGGVVVKDVWAENLEEEMHTMRRMLPSYPVVCVDTEYPGTVHGGGGGGRGRHYMRSPRETYAVVKKDVDALKLLQLGITLSGPVGRCPIVWQFNFSGFDPRSDPHSPSSIAMLKEHGMDFDKLQRSGINHSVFAEAFYRYGLGCRQLMWVAFSGAYDFAYLTKMVTGGRRLPETLEGFMAQVRSIFGPAVLDVKHMARFCGGGIRGGLERVAAALGVKRAAGRAHHAGSDSLLSADVFNTMLERFFPRTNILNHAGAIEGLVYVYVYAFKWLSHELHHPWAYKSATH
ncbi:probable CCR4-associated factor 1 homolog 11 [Oryza brachyantha]|uniref:probable CCR4-associated factor 1 homolog 11 n=1 Tax=Oryza brachyantha TaxID=4533 RepID=UPI001ADC8FC5|nr:probable CCR4-associated factor 1 homolog 11 [Oryza brachyantha]